MIYYFCQLFWRKAKLYKKSWLNEIPNYRFTKIRDLPQNNFLICSLLKN